MYSPRVDRRCLLAHGAQRGAAAAHFSSALSKRISQHNVSTAVVVLQPSPSPKAVRVYDPSRLASAALHTPSRQPSSINQHCLHCCVSHLDAIDGCYLVFTSRFIAIFCVCLAPRATRTLSYSLPIDVLLSMSFATSLSHELCSSLCLVTIDALLRASRARRFRQHTIHPPSSRRHRPRLPSLVRLST